MPRIFHVGKKGNDTNDGSQTEMFRTIQRAADVARAGDTICVHEGVYREWVKPQWGGSDGIHRITYQAADHEKVVIKGSEVVTDWEKEPEKGVWSTRVDNTIFGSYNPFATPIGGDWFEYPTTYDVHYGALYVNGFAFYEAESYESLKHPHMRQPFSRPLSFVVEKIPDAEKTLYQWYAVVGEKETTLYANFHEINPHEAVCEINVRKSCFMPELTGRNYITVRGFEMAQAACQWAPPTSEQTGLMGPYWSKGWIIEHNTIHDAKCSGMSLGKEYSTGNNESSLLQENSGYLHQLEAVFKAYHQGWSKETIGSHIVRNNTIYNCGQNAIVGHLGCVFSTISHNEIHHIATRHEFFGFEVAGIKLHAAIDVHIDHNYIHDCTLGTWLDWEAQGTRIHGNVYHDNDRDVMIEVSHGPYLLDNNIFGSAYNIQNVSQGGAFVHNLFLGSSVRKDCLDRPTPYHMAHATEVAGFSAIFGNDDRYFNNIFVGGTPLHDTNNFNGTSVYDPCPSSYQAYQTMVKASQEGDRERFLAQPQPVYIDGNVYLKGAPHYQKEKHFVCNTTENPAVTISQSKDAVYLDMHMPSQLLEFETQIITTEVLGKVRIAKLIFDNPDGSFLKIDTDMEEIERTSSPIPGPLAMMTPGENHCKIWE